MYALNRLFRDRIVQSKSSVESKLVVAHGRVLEAGIAPKGEEQDTAIVGLHGVTSEDGAMRAEARFRAQLNGEVSSCCRAPCR